MSAKVLSATIVGIQGVPVEVEADVAAGLPAFNLVGLPDAAVKESRERVRAAIRSCGVSFPRTRVTVNLAPADLKKEGPAFDLPIAAAVMLAAGRVEFEREDGTAEGSRDVAGIDPRTVFLGELGLDGRGRPLTGLLPIALACRRIGLTTLVVPRANADEACAVAGLTVLPVSHLREVVQHLLQQEPLTPHQRGVVPQHPPSEELTPSDLAYIHGLHHAKRALEIAAAGGHNVLFTGPPGTGKSLLARSLPTILPTMTDEERLEVTTIHSVVGLTSRDGGLIMERPFRSPHHSASDIAIIGGGAAPKPGEVSLAHRGVLFMDEFPEFDRPVLEGLRQPLEDGMVTVSRAAGSVTFPARFMLVAAQNPCPCGYWGDEQRTCVCSPGAILKYQRKISGPLLDRIDLIVEVPRQPTEVLLQEPKEERSAVMRSKVEAARERQRARAAAGDLPQTNAELSTPQLRGAAPLGDDTRDVLLRAADRFHLSARATIRMLRVSRTIADLTSADTITTAHLQEALSYRQKQEAAV